MKVLSHIIFLFWVSLHVVLGQTCNLTINEGIGSGIYLEGERVHIWSDYIPKGYVFDNWTGSAVPYLDKVNEWHAILDIPKDVGDLYATAVYKERSKEIIQGELMFEMYGDSLGLPLFKVDKQVYYSIPKNAKAMVFLFHGTGGSASSFLQRYERIQIINDLNNAGYGIVATDSNETTVGNQSINNEKIQWDCTNPTFASKDNNVDILNTSLTIDSLIRVFDLPSDIPFFSFGMSNGAVFSDICGSALGFRASAHMTAKGRYGTYIREDILPVIWIMSENDHQESANNDAAYNNYEKMSLVQDAAYYIFERSPVYPKRFMRNIEKLTIEQSESVFQRLNYLNLLDTKNYISTLVLDTIPKHILQGLGLSVVQKRGVVEELKCVNADHIMHADYTKTIIAFFDNYFSAVDIVTTVNDMDVRIYPNPVADMLHIDIPSSGFCQYRLFDSSGRFLCNGNLSKGFELDMSKRLAGFYYVTIEIEEKLITKKIIKI